MAPLNPSAASFTPPTATQSRVDSLQARIEMLNERTNELNTMFMDLQAEFHLVNSNCNIADARIPSRINSEVIGAFGSPADGNSSNNRKRRVQHRLKAMFEALNTLQQSAVMPISAGEYDVAEGIIERGEETLESLRNLMNGLAVGLQKIADLADGSEASSSNDGEQQADTASAQSENADDEDDDDDDDDDDGITIIVERFEDPGETNRRWSSPWRVSDPPTAGCRSSRAVSV